MSGKREATKGKQKKDQAQPVGQSPQEESGYRRLVD